LLKEICIDKLILFSNGTKDDFGGNFEKALKNYEAQKFIKRNMINGNFTTFHPSLRLINKIYEKKLLQYYF
jgi:hypothetical protein